MAKRKRYSIRHIYWLANWNREADELMYQIGRNTGKAERLGEELAELNNNAVTWSDGTKSAIDANGIIRDEQVLPEAELVAAIKSIKTRKN